jgi:hypothetical protein
VDQKETRNSSSGFFVEASKNACNLERFGLITGRISERSFRYVENLCDMWKKTGKRP